MSAYSETRRQLVHMAMGGFALSLPFLSWPQAALLAFAALVFNAFLLARVSPEIIRPADTSGHRAGVLFYPLSVLLLILVFHNRMDIVAAAWGVMAFGDGAATIVGTRVGGPRLPWNPEKTWAGLAAFIIAGAIGAVALGRWVSPELSIYGPIAAAIAAAFVETIPIKLDDNLSVPVAAAATLALLAAAEPDDLGYARQLLTERWLVAIALNIALALGAWARGSLTFTGAAVGTLIGVVIYVGAGLPGWSLLLLSFGLAVVTSRIGRLRKATLGIAEERDEKRGAGNAIANCLVGAIGAWLMAVRPVSVIGELLLVTGLVAGASDTVASEIGKAFGGTTRAFPSLRTVPAGTPGAISSAGTLAGLAAAVAMAMVAGLVLPYMLVYMPLVVIGATVGAFVESALATRYEPRDILNNDVLNFINTAVAALAAFGTLRLLDLLGLIASRQ